MPREAESLNDTLTRVLFDIAMSQDDPAEREAMLAIMRSDGWLPEKAA